MINCGAQSRRRETTWPSEKRSKALQERKDDADVDDERCTTVTAALFNPSRPNAGFVCGTRVLNFTFLSVPTFLGEKEKKTKKREKAEFVPRGLEACV